MPSPFVRLAVAALMLASSTALAGSPVTQRSRATRATAPDSLFQQPYIDLDEMRSTPVPHRYVHGGFKGTDTRFSFYFPPRARYRGRFFQHVTPVPGSENAAQELPPGPYNKIAFAIASGAYFVETNEGGTIDIGKGSGVAQSDPTIISYRANAASAEYSRVVAARMYGPARIYGYVYGGSGGAYHTIAGFENTRGVWDGAVPYVVGSTMAIPNMFTIRLRALRILNDRFPQILDAIEPGGSGDPYAGLNPQEASVLREATRMGFPMRSWFGWKTMGIHGLAALYPAMKMVDRTYFTDFWSTPGYLGADHPEQFAGARLQYKSTIAALISGAEAERLGLNTDASNNRARGGVDNAFRTLSSEAARRVVAVRLAGTPDTVTFLGGDLLVSSGAATGASIPVARLVGDVAVLGVSDADVVAKLAAGDAVQVDNSNFLALETYHWHQVPDASFRVWDQFRAANGTPLHPQRAFLMGPAFMQASFGPMESGVFEGKMIVLSSLWDREAMPWQGDWYLQRIRTHFGAAADDHVRIYYTDHAQHGDEPDIEDPTHTVSYNGVLQQALRDLSAWVEQGVAPPASTEYRIDDGQVIVPPTAAARKGVQPVVALMANGAKRAEITADQPVTLTATIVVPPGTGTLIAADWDLEGSGAFADHAVIPPGKATLTVSMTHRFTRPGTYFPVVRATSQRTGNRTTPFARIDNIDRVRVVVK